MGRIAHDLCDTLGRLVIHVLYSNYMRGTGCEKGGVMRHELHVKYYIVKREKRGRGIGRIQLICVW
jgi:hypothetical protein